MTLEAAAGKNPVTHVGKIYNVVAREIAEALAAAELDITAAQCFLMGQIGASVTEPALVHIKLATRDEISVAQFEQRVNEISRAHLGRSSELVDNFILGTINVF